MSVAEMQLTVKEWWLDKVRFKNQGKYAGLTPPINSALIINPFIPVIGA
jgi:hypothetical protein